MDIQTTSVMINCQVKISSKKNDDNHNGEILNFSTKCQNAQELFCELLISDISNNNLFSVKESVSVGVGGCWQWPAIL